jgi:S-DNA-T family DNA segregation ATPase FtsK/SpoIIIE
MKRSLSYNRAARIIEKMEEEGIVGPPDGSKPREVLVDLDRLRR